MDRPRSAFDDESPFTLDELPRLHPFAEELAQAEELGDEAEDIGHIDEFDGEAWDGEAEVAAELALEEEIPAGPTLGVLARWQRRIEMTRIRAAFDTGKKQTSALADLVFTARHPGKKATDSAELRADWRDIHDHLVPAALMTGPFHGPQHETTTVPERRKGGHGALLSDLSIWPRGIQEARAIAKPRAVGHVVVHTIGRSGKSKASGYKTPAIDFAVKWYLEGAVGPHYVIDLNGTIVGICDERRLKGHVGWSKDDVDYRKVFGDPSWTPPSWWSAVWRGVAKTPLELLPAGAKRPNDRSIGIELVPLPDATFTPEQYASLGALLADIETRYRGTLTIDAAPGKGLHGHEDLSPLAAHEPHRVDAKGGKDPGAHRSTPVFHWSIVAAELAKARAMPGRSATAARAVEPAREQFLWVHEHARDDEGVESFADDREDAEQLDVGCEHGECEHAEHQRFGHEHEHHEHEHFEPEHFEHECSGCRAAADGEAFACECNGECEGMHDGERLAAAEAEASPFADEVPSETDERATITAAYRAGERRPNELTDLVFAKRHPELGGGRIPEGDSKLIEEWKKIRRNLVRPTLHDLEESGAPARVADVVLGTLHHRAPNGGELSYTFTAEDLEWTARYLQGEAGAGLEQIVVLWAMVNRFAFIRRWKTFAGLLRAYSTPLQYPLNSVGAAYRHWQHCPGTKCQYVDLSAQFGHYPPYKDVKIPKGQLRTFIALQRTPWAQLRASARRVAAEVLSGKLPNPAGRVTEFADTAVYWRDHNPKKKGPTRAQWLAFTKTFAQGKRWLWPSDTSPYDQLDRNVLFVEARFEKHDPPTITTPGGTTHEDEDPGAITYEQDEQGEHEHSPFGGDAHHAQGGLAALEIEHFGTDEHGLLGDAIVQNGVQAMIDHWAQRGLIDGGAFIATGASKLMPNRADPLDEWTIVVPQANATAPYARQTLPAGAKWHWIAPDPVFRKPGERWTANTLRQAIVAGEAVVLSVGQIVFLAGDLVRTFMELKRPDLHPSMSKAPHGMYGAYLGHDPYAWELLSQLSPDPHLGDTRIPSEKAKKLAALREIHDAARAGRYEQVRQQLASPSRPAWATRLKQHVDLLQKARGPSGFTELHLLAQVLWRPGAASGAVIVQHAPWIDAVTRPVLTMQPSYAHDFFQQIVTSGRYLALAEDNATHFQPLAWTTFESSLQAALQAIDTHIASKTSPHPIPADAIAQLAFGLHFLTDSFSAGHMRTPRKLAGLGALLMHDIEGNVGLNVENGFGKRWRAFGDGHLRSPSALGKQILFSLRDSGIDISPVANLDAVRKAVGAATKQLHYHAQQHRKRSGSAQVHAVLDANRRGASLLEGDALSIGDPGPGNDATAWIDMTTAQRVTYLRKHKPVPLPEGRQWDTRAENPPPLFDARGKIATHGYRWAKDWSKLNDNRRIKIQRSSGLAEIAGVSEPDVLDVSEIYQAVINAPPQARSWAPDGSRVIEVFDTLPEDKLD